MVLLVVCVYLWLAGSFGSLASWIPRVTWDAPRENDTAGAARPVVERFATPVPATARIPSSSAAPLPPPTTPQQQQEERKRLWKAYVTNYTDAISLPEIATLSSNVFTTYSLDQMNRGIHTDLGRRMEDFLLLPGHLADPCVSTIEIRPRDDKSRRFPFHVVLRLPPPTPRAAPPSIQPIDYSTIKLSQATLQGLHEDGTADPLPSKPDTLAIAEEKRKEMFLHLLYPRSNISTYNTTGHLIHLYEKFVSNELPLHCRGHQENGVAVSVDERPMWRRNHVNTLYLTLANVLEYGSFKDNHAICLQHYEEIFWGNWPCSNQLAPPNAVQRSNVLASMLSSKKKKLEEAGSASSSASAAAPAEPAKATSHLPARPVIVMPEYDWANL